MNSSQHVDSYYAATANNLRDFPTLEGEQQCDVCVIGGGFTGLSTALHLVEAGYEVVLAEAERPGWGASGRNGGQLCSGMRKDQSVLEDMFGHTRAHELWDFAEEAKQIVRERIARHSIQCDLKPGLLSVAYKPHEAAQLAGYAEKLNREYDYPHTRAVSREELSDMIGTSMYYGGELDTDAGHLHPLNYALGLADAATAAGARIFANTRVTSLEYRDGRHRVRSASGVVKARYVVLACNGYLENLEPRVTGKIMPVNNFVLATEPLDEARAREIIRDDVAVVDTKFLVDYYRLSADKRLLFGGGENYTRKFPADMKTFVRKYMLRVYPQLADVRIDYAWGGTLAVTLKRMPCFGRLEKDIYYAQGYSGQGVSLTSLAGKLLAEAIAGTAERFDVFAAIPKPTFPGGTLLRWPGLVAGMLYYTMKDRF